MKVRKAYVFTGLPASGKSEASRLGAQIANGQRLSAGTMIRNMARKDGLGSPTSEELAQFAVDMREKHGPTFFADFVIRDITQDEFEPTYPLFIDSCRHHDSVVAFKEFFDYTECIWIDCPRDVRLDRIQTRGRDDEADFDNADLMQRDNNELEKLGVATIMDSDIVDRVVSNDGSKTDLEQSMAAILRCETSHA